VQKTGRGRFLANNPIEAGTGLWYLRAIQEKGIRPAYGMVVIFSTNFFGEKFHGSAFITYSEPRHTRNMV
jgi:hypothetical protein